MVVTFASSMPPPKKIVLEIKKNGKLTEKLEYDVELVSAKELTKRQALFTVRIKGLKIFPRFMVPIFFGNECKIER